MERFTKHDAETIHAIVERASKEFPGFDKLSANMDLTACHLNGCPLKLKELLTAEDGFDFAHDFFGIRRHINRRTGQLEDSFLPRYAQL